MLALRFIKLDFFRKKTWTDGEIVVRDTRSLIYHKYGSLIMPKVMGVNVLGSALAGLLMFLLGYVVYGVIFKTYSEMAYGYTMADYEGTNPAWMIGGLVIELVIAFGIAKMLKVANVTGLQESVKFAVMLGLLLAIPLAAYNFIYGIHHSVQAFLINSGHLLVNFAVAGAILSKFD